jgi:hypothetical protein
MDGVKDAAVDIVNMELVVTAEGARPDVQSLIRSIRDACAHPRPGR